MSAQQDQALSDTASKTLLKFLNGYLDASRHRDATLLSVTLHPDCTRRIAPSTFLAHIRAPDDLVIGNRLYEEGYAKHFPVVNRFIDGTELTLDMALFLKLTPDGTQVTEVLEFIDSLAFVRYHEKLDLGLAKLEKKD